MSACLVELEMGLRIRSEEVGGWRVLMPLGLDRLMPGAGPAAASFRPVSVMYEGCVCGMREGSWVL